MALYEYSALDTRGKQKRGVVEAPGQQAASRKLKAMGVFPVSLQEASSPEQKLRRRFSRRVQVLHLAVATRQLGTMLSAGMSLGEALATVADQPESPVLGQALIRVREAVLQGTALHQALGQEKRVFPALYLNMVEVGEASGTLDQALAQLAMFLEDQAKLNARLKAAMTYPLLMLLVGGGVLFFLVTFVVPKITRMLTDLDQALPLATLFLITISQFLANYWWLLGLTALGVVLLARKLLAREKGRLWFDRQKFRIPLFGILGLQNATARFARTLATLLRSGVPLLTALDIVRGLLTNRRLQVCIEQVRDAVREGGGLADPLRKTGVFPPMLVRMVAVGEQSGNLEEMLLKVAESYEYQVETRLNGLMSLLEPLMILVMGGVVGFIVLAILLPIFQASQGMG